MKIFGYIIVGLGLVVCLGLILNRMGVLPFGNSPAPVSATSISGSVTLSDVSAKLAETRAMLDGLSQRDQVYYAARTPLDLWMGQVASLMKSSAPPTNPQQFEQSLKNMILNCDDLEQYMKDGTLTQAEFTSWSATIVTRGKQLEQQYP